jgi:flagellar motor switch protein FliG
MEIKAKRQAAGDFIIEVGPVIFNLPENVVQALNQVITDRFSRVTEQDKKITEKRLEAYRALAAKFCQIEDAVIQQVLTQIAPEQMVTLARITGDRSVYQKILKNLSRQNGRQFEDDYARIKKITVHQASVQMENMVPILKKAIQQRKSGLG